MASGGVTEVISTQRRASTSRSVEGLLFMRAPLHLSLVLGTTVVFIERVLMTWPAPGKGNAATVD